MKSAFVKMINILANKWLMAVGLVVVVLGLFSHEYVINSGFFLIAVQSICREIVLWAYSKGYS